MFSEIDPVPMILASQHERGMEATQQDFINVAALPVWSRDNSVFTESNQDAVIRGAAIAEQMSSYNRSDGMNEVNFEKDLLRSYG